MGQVAITLKVMPESPEVDIGKLKEEIRNSVDVKEIREEPIGFGLVALKVLIVLQDSTGGTDMIEKSISEISGVASVDTEDVTLL
ncbi:MAG: elongation factor 1-beta [Candidatus Aenigmarchaeota archaeon]|nr:elongation factor 1-beta [Candidatus Aenigmarchaeota archaeon]